MYFFLLVEEKLFLSESATCKLRDMGLRKTVGKLIYPNWQKGKMINEP